MLATGTTVAGYRIESVIGAGGMGTVYEATQLSLDRTVALKVLAPAFGRDGDFANRFRREAMLQAALEHPSIVPVYEAGESDDGLFIAMKLVRGSDLKRLAEEGLEPERALAILAQAAAALDTAHASGLVHRDVRPQNILVDGEERAYLADFGLTKGAGDRGVTLTGQYMGSLDYAAPEVVRGEPWGPQADVYAFAAVLCEALTGEPPFLHETEAALLYAHVNEPPPCPSDRRPELPGALDDVVARGLAKRPEDRYRRATDLVEDARRALASPPAAAENGRRRFEETIVEPAGLTAPPVVELADERELPWRAIAIGALVVVALALAGYALGRATRGGGGGELLGTAAAGPISLSFPDADWRGPVAAPKIAGLTLDGAVAITSRKDDRPGTLVAGIARDAQGAGLLPPGLQRQLAGAATPRPARVGPYAGLVYRALPVTRVASRLDLVLVPVAGGAAAIACLTPRVLPARARPASCDEVAATLRLRGVRALPLGSTGPYTSALSSALARLDGEQAALRAQLAASARRADQARVAHALAAAYAGAAARIARVRPSPFARPSHVALVGALREAVRAHDALSAAARAGDSGAYASATARVEPAERKVDASIRRFERLRLR
jgi:predicted Ser/Thr protein kinase